MRSRVLPALGLSVVALALATSLAAPASAGSAPTAATNGAGTVGLTGDAAVCDANAGVPDGNGFTSQNFETAFDAYDANGAADFKVKKGTKCKVQSVDIAGSFSAAGPARDATVTIIKGANPGTGTVKCTATGGGSGPNFTVPVSGCKLRKGKYWVTAQSNQDFGTAGQWYWSVTGEIKGAEDMWHNPGGGFGTTCTASYDTNFNCLAIAVSDYLFSVNGKIIT